MVEDQARMEWLEKAHLELQEKHAKSCDDISQMMEMLKMLTKNKQSIEASIPHAETTPLRNTEEDIISTRFRISSRNPGNLCFTITNFPF